MIKNLKASRNISVPLSREPFALLSVNRAKSEFRQGRILAIQTGDGNSILAIAAEFITENNLQELVRISKNKLILGLTAARALSLGFDKPKGSIVTLSPKKTITARDIHILADPLMKTNANNVIFRIKETLAYDRAQAAITLAKISQLLPAICFTELTNNIKDLKLWCTQHNFILVDAGDVFQYETIASKLLKKASEANVPLKNTENCRVISFRPNDGGTEHLAIVIGNIDPTQPVLTRIHSECFTGDVLGSLRCDCGEQLSGAIDEITANGSGVLLYLKQEGRNIGLVNKLRAYTLQDKGFDTFDANEELGFNADERIYHPAGQILSLLEIHTVRLMTNNPIKINALKEFGLTVTQRIPHAFKTNKHNETYINTKKSRSGHLI